MATSVCIQNYCCQNWRNHGRRCDCCGLPCRCL